MPYMLNLHVTIVICCLGQLLGSTALPRSRRQLPRQSASNPGVSATTLAKAKPNVASIMADAGGLSKQPALSVRFNHIGQS